MAVGIRRRRVVHCAAKYIDGCRALPTPTSHGHRCRCPYQLTGSALPSSYPAADWMPTSARSRNSGTERAPA